MQRNMCLRTGIIAIVCSFLLSRACQADTIYSTLGPQPYMSNSYNYTVGWIYNAPSAVGVGVGIAAPFTFGVSPYQLNAVTLDVGLGLTEQAPNLQIAIYTDDGGHPSLTPITTLEPNPSLVTTFVDRRLITYSWINQTILSPNIAYWLAVQPHSTGGTTEENNALYYLSSSILPQTFPAARRDFIGGSWGNWTVYPNSPQPVFSLDGTAVPEPGTWALLALGTAAFWCATRRRRK